MVDCDLFIKTLEEIGTPVEEACINLMEMLVPTKLPELLTNHSADTQRIGTQDQVLQICCQSLLVSESSTITTTLGSVSSVPISDNVSYEASAYHLKLSQNPAWVVASIIVLSGGVVALLSLLKWIKNSVVAYYQGENASLSVDVSVEDNSQPQHNPSAVVHSVWV